MKIAVYGATGRIGSGIVAEAARRGHEVTAVSRRGTDTHHATGRAADLADTAALREIAAGHDVVVLSTPPDRAGGPHEPFLAAHERIATLPSLPARLFVVGGAGSLEVDGRRMTEFPEFPEAYRREAVTMGEVLDVYRASTTLDWTVLSPAPEIAPGTCTGTYRVGGDSPVGDGISTEDFAIAVLDELETPRHRGRRFTVAT